MPSPGGYTEWSVKVSGGTDMRKALRGVGDGLKDLKWVHLNVAQTVAIAARQNAPRKTGRLIGSIKPKATQNSARVEGGGGVPWFAVREFGGGIRWKPGTFAVLKRTTAGGRTVRGSVREVWSGGSFAKWANGRIVRARPHRIPAKPHSGEGYILFKAARDKREKVKQDYLDGVNKLLARHGLGSAR